MTDHNPFGCDDGEYPLDGPNPLSTFPRVLYKNTDFKYQLAQLIRNIYKNLSDTQQGASLVGYSEEMTVREVLDFLLINSGTGPINFLELLEGKVDKVEDKELSANDFDDAAKAKLEGIAENATVNKTDAYLLNRANHLGTQEISTVEGLTAALNSKVNQTSLDAKVDKVAGKGLSEEDFTTTLKNKLELLNPSFGVVASIIAGDGIIVDDSDPINPIVTATGSGVVKSVVAGDGISIDNSDPTNPVINSTGSGGTEVNVQTGTAYTLVPADAFKMVIMDNADANTLTVPSNNVVEFPANTRIDLGQDGAGQTTIVADTGVTIRTPETLKLRKQWSKATLIRRATDVWDITGDLEALGSQPGVYVYEFTLQAGTSEEFPITGYLVEGIGSISPDQVSILEMDMPMMMVGVAPAAMINPDWSGGLFVVQLNSTESVIMDSVVVEIAGRTIPLMPVNEPGILAFMSEPDDDLLTLLDVGSEYPMTLTLTNPAIQIFEPKGEGIVFDVAAENFLSTRVGFNNPPGSISPMTLTYGGVTFNVTTCYTIDTGGRGTNLFLQFQGPSAGFLFDGAGFEYGGRMYPAYVTQVDVNGGVVLIFEAMSPHIEMFTPGQSNQFTLYPGIEGP